MVSKYYRYQLGTVYRFLIAVKRCDSAPRLLSSLSYSRRAAKARAHSKRYPSSSVPDPGGPEPPDPHVFGPPGSGSISQRYGSGSFYDQAKIVRKTLIPTDL